MRRLIAGTSIWMALLIAPAHAADEAIDRLISKLPPPQKFVDPAVNDPLAKQITAASKAHNYGLALDLSRRLASRYPKSLEAQMVHGILAMSVRQFREAMDAYHRALSIRPDFPPAYFGLGITNVAQNRFGAALSNFKQITRIAPQLEVGWVGSSVCAERLGRKRDSLEFARRATAVAPSSAGAWFQLAREENLAGNNQAAKAALLRGNQLQRNAPKAKPAQR
jgi:tetratricopeptide (TPR) repeat protein